MQLRLKIFLLSIVPTAIAVGLVILTVQSQTLKLAKQERDLVESTYLASKEAELRAYVWLAKSAIEAQVSASDTDTPARQAQAMAILRRLEFGKDGYFFLYDMAGNNLMHSRQPELVGQNLRELKDPYGGSPIQALLAATRQGGGTVRYFWAKPSTGQVASKLGYVEPITSWGWMLGTGLYLDDIEQTLQRIDAQAQTNIQDTQRHMYTIAAAAMILIALAGLAVNLSDHRESSAKLRHLAQRVVNSQEDERVRVAQELHDGIIQVLVSANARASSPRRGTLGPREGARARHRHRRTRRGFPCAGVAARFPQGFLHAVHGLRDLPDRVRAEAGEIARASRQGGTLLDGCLDWRRVGACGRGRRNAFGAVPRLVRGALPDRHRHIGGNRLRGGRRGNRGIPCRGAHGSRGAERRDRLYLPPGLDRHLDHQRFRRPNRCPPHAPAAGEHAEEGLRGLHPRVDAETRALALA